MNDVVYAFQFCFCIYESGYVTVSLHYTLKGAKKAMREHKKKEMIDSEYNRDKRWTVRPMKIEP